MPKTFMRNDCVLYDLNIHVFKQELQELSDSEIAKKYNAARNTVAKLRKRLGVARLEKVQEKVNGK